MRAEQLLVVTGIGIGAIALLPKAAEATGFPGAGFSVIGDITVTRDSEVYPIQDFLEPEAMQAVYNQYAVPDGAANVLSLLDVVLVEIVYFDESMEYFQFPSETWGLKYGDCEDTSFLLASLLLIAGIEVYVALGFFYYEGINYGHAWVVVKLDEQYYVLETTLDSLPANPWLTLYDSAPNYNPYVYFNDTVIWVRPGYDQFQAIQAGGKRDAIYDYWGKRE